MDMKTSPLASLVDSSLLKTDALVNGEWRYGASIRTRPRRGHQGIDDYVEIKYLCLGDIQR